MTSNRPLVLVVLGAALLAAVGALLLVLQGGGPSTVETPREREAEAPESKLVATEPLVAPAAREEEPDRELASEPESSTTENFSLEGAHWIEGTVRFPPGSPSDETLVVAAVERELEDDEARGSARDEELRWIMLPPADGMEEHASRRAVAADGSFRVPFPKGATAGFLALEGRYLYLEELARIDLAAQRGRVSLEPKLGAWITGAIELPPKAGSDLDLGVLAGKTADLSGGFMARNGQFGRTATVTPEGSFEFRGVPSSSMVLFRFDPEVCPEVFELGWEFQPGEHVHKRIQLATGVILSGRALDPERKPLAEVALTATAPGGFGFGNASRDGKTDAEGRFHLRGVPAGEVSLRGSKQGWLDAEVELGRIEDGETRTGLELVLGTGNRVSGIVRWPDGRPAAGAKVTVAPMEFSIEESPWQPDSRADEKGAFRISGLGKGPFVVRAVAVPPDAEESAAQPPWKARAAGVAANTDGLALMLAKPLAVRGRAVDDLGAPLGRFEVTASLLDVGEDLEETASDRFSPADGAFLLAGVSPGRWSLQAEAEDHTTSKSATVVVPSEEPVILVLPRAARIAGSVVDPAGKPVEGAEVRAGSPGDESWFSVDAKTGADGCFELSGVRAGSASVTARAEGFAPSAEALVEIAPGERIQGVVLALSAGGRLEGEIYTAAGAPDPGRGIMVQGMGRGDGGSAESDSAGRFAVEGLQPGVYQVIALPGGKQLAAISQGDQSQLLSQFRMASVEIREGETAHVVLGGAPKDPVRVFGRVTAAGEPLPNGLVMALLEGGPLLSSMKMGQTSADGRYEIVLDQPGDYTLIVTSEMGAQDGVEFNETIPARSEVEIDLALPLGSIEGRVLDARGGALEDADVFLQFEEASTLLMNLSGGRETSTDASGAFRFAGLKAGTYTLRAGADGHGTLVRDGIAVVADEASAVIELRLPGVGTLTGSVRDSAGAPVEGASVFVRDAQGRALALVSECATDASGGFSCEGLPAGVVTVSARKGALCCRDSAPVRIPEDGEASIELELEAGTLLRVRLAGEGGGALRARVSVLDEHGRDWSGLLDAEGVQQLLTEGFSSTEQKIGPLAPGAYRVKATTADGRSASKPVTLGGQPERSVTLTLKD